MAAPFDPNPNIRSADRGAVNTIISGATSTVGYAFTRPNLPASSIAYGRTSNPNREVNPTASFQIKTTGGNASGNFLGSNDLSTWDSIGTYDTASGTGAFAVALVSGFRYVSASIDAMTASSVDITAVL